jgi:hypothetical protein
VIHIREARTGPPQHPDPDHDKQRAEKEGRHRLVAMMSVVVIGIRFLGASAIRDEHDEIGDQIRQRMDTVGDQRLRMREGTYRDLQAHQHQVQCDAHERGFARDSLFLSGFEFGGVGMHREMREKTWFMSILPSAARPRADITLFFLLNQDVMRTRRILIPRRVRTVAAESS